MGFNPQKTLILSLFKDELEGNGITSVDCCVMLFLIDKDKTFLINGDSENGEVLKQKNEVNPKFKNVFVRGAEKQIGASIEKFSVFLDFVKKDVYFKVYFTKDNIKQNQIINL